MPLKIVVFYGSVRAERQDIKCDKPGLPPERLRGSKLCGSIGEVVCVDEGRRNSLSGPRPCDNQILSVSHEVCIP